jgi:hypothetical protein
MIDWYGNVVGMVMIYSTLNTRGSEDGMSAAFVSNDKANHRMAINSLPRLQEDTDKKTHVKLQQALLCLLSFGLCLYLLFCQQFLLSTFISSTFPGQTKSYTSR